MKKIRKIVAILLLFSMIAGVLYSCGSEDGGNGDISGDGGENNQQANIPGGDGGDDGGEPEEEGRIEPNLPEKDLNGDTFTFYVMGYERNVNNYSMEIYAESETGDVINDAVYRRNRYVEDKYNFVTEEYPESGSLADGARRNLLAGEDVHQVFMANIRDTITLANQGFLHDLNTVDHIDLDKPWWDSRSNDGFSVLKRLYFTTGDINIMDNNATWAVFFNKKMIQDMGLTAPYAYVQNNEWTLEKYYEMSKAAAKDLNGDGTMHPDDDQWGTVGDYMNTFMLFIASGERMTKKDGDDTPFLEVINERSATVMDKVLDIQLDIDSTLHANDHSGKYANVWEDMLRRNFRQDRALFYIAGMLTYTLLRDMESEFGMVPMPKLDAAQDRYYTTYNPNNASVLSIPVTNQRLSDTGLIVEALAAESLYTLTPAYYEVALERKYMRDEESRAMLDIILDSRIFDLNIVYDWGGTYGIFERLTQRRARDFASEFEKVKERAEAAIEDTVETFHSFE